MEKAFLAAQGFLLQYILSVLNKNNIFATCLLRYLNFIFSSFVHLIIKLFYKMHFKIWMLILDMVVFSSDSRAMFSHLSWLISPSSIWDRSIVLFLFLFPIIFSLPVCHIQEIMSPLIWKPSKTIPKSQAIRCTIHCEKGAA